MRLSVITQGGQRKLMHRLKLFMMRVFTGSEAPDVMKTLTYRSDFFGLAFSDLTHEVLRGDSNWSPGQRELFAAFTSKLNECFF